MKLHWLRILRGATVIDQLQRERMRLIQREKQLEHHVLSGSWTLLAVLDDVRPGDVIESGYTVVSRHPINAGWCEAFFGIPMRIAVASFRFRVVMSASRVSPRVKTSADFPPRTERTLSAGRLEWTWQGQQLDPLSPETNIPGSTLAYPWLQLSDVADWPQLSQRVAEAWERAAPATGLASLPEFAPPAEVDAAAILRLLRQIQEHFRYLSVDLESGSWIPAPPGMVAVQRRGDCKDLAWLAACVLRNWRVAARPMLVATVLREAVSSLLPMSSLFNHAVLEVDWEGERRWFDLTLKDQGGTFESQVVGAYGFGLPVDAGGADLTPQPPQVSRAFYAVREVVDIDTRRDMASGIELRVRTEGAQADAMRHNRAIHGPEEYAKERLTQVQRRYPNAKRQGELLFRDDRERNICEQVETFTAVLPITPGDRGGRSVYEPPGGIVARTFAVPDDRPRIHPWAMPYLVDFRHNFTVRSKSFGHQPTRRRRWSAQNVDITLENIRLRGEWSLVTRMLGDGDIPAAAVSDYRTKYRDYLRVASIRYLLPAEVRRPEAPSDWGRLPDPSQGRAAYVADDRAQNFPDARIGEVDQQKVKRTWRSFLPSQSRITNLWLVWILLVGISSLVRSCSETH